MAVRSPQTLTGGRNHWPPHEAIDFLKNESFWELRTQPRSLTFIGGGIISADLGHTMRRFGSEVNLVEHEPRITSVVDDDVAHA